MVLLETVKKMVGSGWNKDKSDWTYSSVSATYGYSTLTIDDGDASGYLQPGDKIKVINGGVVKYFIVLYVNYSDPDTTVIGWGGTDYTLVDSAITETYYSHAKSPMGFPMEKSKWSIVETSSTTQTNPVSGTYYNADSIAIPLGIWDVKYSAMVYSYGTDLNLYIYNYLTLSDTSGNDEGDAEWRSLFFWRGGGNIARLGAWLSQHGQLELEASASYFVNGAVTFNADVDNLQMNSLRIVATCAYL